MRVGDKLAELLVEEYIGLEASPNGPAVIEIISDQWETPVLGLKRPA